MLRLCLEIQFYFFKNSRPLDSNSMHQQNANGFYQILDLISPVWPYSKVKVLLESYKLSETCFSLFLIINN